MEWWKDGGGKVEVEEDGGRMVDGGRWRMEVWRWRKDGWMEGEKIKKNKNGKPLQSYYILTPRGGGPDTKQPRLFVLLQKVRLAIHRKWERCFAFVAGISRSAGISVVA